MSRTTRKTGTADRAGLLTALSAVLCASLLAASCTTQTDDTGAGRDVASITPEGLKRDLGTFRDPYGLYFSPQALAGGGSVYSTALFTTGLPTLVSKPAVTPSLVGAACTGDDADVVEGVWKFWSVATVVGSARDAGPAWRCVDKRLPAPSGDPANDVPQAWAWAAAEQADGSGLASSRARLIAVLDAADPATLPPYVMWRWTQLADLVHHPVPVLHPKPVTTLESTADLLDLWGTSELCRAGTSCGGLDAFSDEQIVAAQRHLGDDLSLTAAAALLERRRSPLLQDLLRQIRARTVEATGLVRSAAPQGEINSTFKVLQIAPDLFAPAERSAAAVRMRLDRVPRTDRVLRTRALAVLRAFGGDLGPFADELEQARRTLEAEPVTAAGARNAINLAEALRIVDPGWTPTLDLTLFTVSSSKDLDAALLVLTNADLFANRKAITKHFAGLTDRLRDRVAVPADPLTYFYHSINALPQVQAQFDAGSDAEMRKRVVPLQGCVVSGHRLPSLFVANTSAGRPCSLDGTWLVYRSGYYPNGV